MQLPYILGIDIGTGSTKAVAVNSDGEAVFTVQHHYPVDHPKPGYSEQNPVLIWEAFVKCIHDVMEGFATLPVAVSLSSAMHGLIPVDISGEILHPMLTWADARSASIAEELRSSELGEDLYTVSGTPVYAMAPLAKIIWFRKNRPGVFNKAAKFIAIKEYIWYQLFRTFEVDHSIASGTGLFDIVNCSWNKQALEVAGISESQLSIPVSTGFSRKGFREALLHPKLPSTTPFVIGASDGVLANLGSHVIQPGIAALTIGTSGAVRTTNPSPIYNFKAMTFNYRLDENLFVCGGPVNNGGIAIQWLLKNLEGKSALKSEDYGALFNKISAVEVGSRGLLFLPYLSGERAPVWDTGACGVFFGVRLHHDSAYFARAVLEGVCFALYQVLDALESGRGGAVPIKQINVSGGFVHSSTWIKILADITGKPICLVQDGDASATGAAFLAMKALGMIDDYSSVLKKTKLAFVQPDEVNHEIYKKNFLIFKELYSSLKDCMHLLHNDNQP